MGNRPIYTDEIPAIDMFEGDHRYLSNFGAGTVEFDGVLYPTSEHAYQAAKTDIPSERSLIAAAKSPGEAKRLGQQVTMSGSFEAEKLSIMKAIVSDKFHRNPDIAEQLINTYPAKLVEGNTWHDNYWGDCRCGHCSSKTGQNHLGRILMEVRDELLDEKAAVEDDMMFMLAAVELAESNLDSGNGGPFGAVVVKDGNIIGSGSNSVLGDRDSTAHAEMNAIRDAERNIGSADLSGCTLYTTCFPCPMCLGAIVWANISCCVYGNTKEDAAAIGFRDDAIYDLAKSIADGEMKPMFTELDLEFEQAGREEALKAFDEYRKRGLEMY